MLAIIMAIENEQDRLFVESIFNKYSEKMYLIAMDIINNHYDAEDCVHDTIVKIIDKLERFKQANREDYLIKLIVITCRNTAINKYKENKKRNYWEISTTVFDEEEESSIMDIPDLSSNVEKIVINKFTCNYIKEIIDKLDLKYRDVIVLKGYGYGYEEIAYLMHISQELVRKRYSRAKKMIIEMGGDILYEYGN